MPYPSTVTELHQTIADLRGEVADTRAAATAHRERISSLESAARERARWSESQRRVVAELQDNVNGAKVQHENQKNRIRAYQVQVGRLDATNNGLEARNDWQSNRIKALGVKIQEKRAGLQELEGAVSSLEDERNNLQLRFHESPDHCRADAQRVVELNAQADKSIAQISALQQERDGLRAVAGGLQTALNTAGGTRRRLKAEVDDARKQLAGVVTSRADYIRLCQERSVVINELQAEVKADLRQKQDLRRQLDDANRAITVLQDEAGLSRVEIGNAIHDALSQAFDVKPGYRTTAEMMQEIQRLRVLDNDTRIGARAIAEARTAASNLTHGSMARVLCGVLGIDPSHTWSDALHKADANAAALRRGVHSIATARDQATAAINQALSTALGACPGSLPNAEMIADIQKMCGMLNAAADLTERQDADIRKAEEKAKAGVRARQHDALCSVLEVDSDSLPWSDALQRVEKLRMDLQAADGDRIDAVAKGRNRTHNSMHRALCQKLGAEVSWPDALQRVYKLQARDTYARSAKSSAGAMAVEIERLTDAYDTLTRKATVLDTELTRSRAHVVSLQSKIAGMDALTDDAKSFALRVQTMQTEIDMLKINNNELTLCSRTFKKQASALRDQLDAAACVEDTMQTYNRTARERISRQVTEIEGLEQADTSWRQTHDKLFCEYAELEAALADTRAHLKEALDASKP